jgi:hypothetical protein
MCKLPDDIVMVQWWWLLIEAVVLVGYALALRGWTRKQALVDALTDPKSAQAEVDALPEFYRRWLLSGPGDGPLRGAR